MRWWGRRSQDDSTVNCSTELFLSSNVVVQKTRMFWINDSGVCLTILLLKKVWEVLMFPKDFDYLPMYREYCVQFKRQMQKAYSVLKSFTHTQKVLIQLWQRYQAIFYHRVLATLFCRHIAGYVSTQAVIVKKNLHFHKFSDTCGRCLT